MLATTSREVLPHWVESYFPWLDMRDLMRWMGMPEQRIRVEELVDGNQLLIRAELPGFAKDDITMFIRDGFLHIEAERKKEEKLEEGSGYRSEFHYGTFIRDIRVPSELTVNDVKASYKDGILEVRVTLPTPPPEKEPAPIPIMMG